MTHTIYALIDPRTGKARYVGCTMNLQTRTGQHYTGHDGSTGEWVKELRAANLIFQVSVLETCDSLSTGRAAESKWIGKLYVAGCDLLNKMTPLAKRLAEAKA